MISTTMSSSNRSVHDAKLAPSAPLEQIQESVDERDCDEQQLILERRNMNILLKRAREGNVKAMEGCGHRFFHGIDGFKQDDKMAYMWYSKACRSGSVIGLAVKGYMMATGVGTKLNEKDGIMYLSRAAGKGSDWAAYMLGLALADGKCGLASNTLEAVHWLEISLSGSCPHKHMSEECKGDALQRLDALVLPKLLERIVEERLPKASSSAKDCVPNRTFPLPKTSQGARY